MKGVIVVLPRVTEMTTQAATLTNGIVLLSEVNLSNIIVKVLTNGSRINLTYTKELYHTDINTASDVGSFQYY